MGYKRMRKREGGYYTGRHSCFLLQYHLVLVTKFRKPVIYGSLEEYFKQYTREYFVERDAPVMEMETMPDHVHILFETVPGINLGEFVGAFKAASSRHIRKMFQQQLKQFYWKPFFWSSSYFLATVSERNTEIVKRYISEQKGDE